MSHDGSSEDEPCATRALADAPWIVPVVSVPGPDGGFSAARILLVDDDPMLLRALGEVVAVARPGGVGGDVRLRHRGAAAD